MKVGDYVRFKPELMEKICKIKEFKNDGFLVNIDDTSYWFEESDVLKSSPNIIDLIEVGDYVNGYKVLEIEKDYLFDYREEINVLIVQNDEVYEVAKKIYSDDIKSIVTKEQFESMGYKVESEVN